MTVEERIYTLSCLWKEAEYNFAFWAERSDVDWNAEYRRFLPLVMNAEGDLEFYRLLMRFYALLRDGHTSVSPPAALFEGRCVPFGVTRAEGKFLLAAAPEERFLFAELTSIQGLPTAEYVEKYVYPYWWHELPESLFALYDCVECSLMLNFGAEELITVGTDKGGFSFKQSEPREPVFAELSARPPEPLAERFRSESLIISVTEDDLAFIELLDFHSAEIVGEFAENIALLKGCRGYIIDVRGNPGGMGDPPLEIAKRFISGKFPVKSDCKTPSHSAKYHALEPYIDMSAPDLSDPWQRRIYEVATHTYYERLEDNGEVGGFIDFGGQAELTAPAVLLANCGTACAAETFVSYFRMSGRAKIVGATTYGSGAEAMIRELPLGGTVSIATTRSRLPDGSEYVNVGIKPDIPAEKTIGDLKSGLDGILKKGLEVLRADTERMMI
ncbi:MAG: S41 family peptidase [Lachnospiraceae bacterium]|nr:S41 family peptidase [Ruminococcus sp.]MCM1274610.1 S41 family peptidase [Lachnospiraceae bacterium]